MGESQGMRGQSGQSPVFHVPPGGTEAAARRPISEVAGSTELALLPWGALIWVLIGSILR